MSQEIKVISLVPSWTETLIEAGIHVVGRTRFCIHPEHLVQSIPVVGGTKSLDMDVCLSLDANFILFDREENTTEMVKQCEDAGFRWIATHVTDLKSCAHELNRLAELFKNNQLKKWSDDYLQICKRIKEKLTHQTLRLEQIKKQGVVQITNSQLSVFSYVIWKNPYMIVTRETFIGDVLSLLGIEIQSRHEYWGHKYPVVQEQELKKMYCLFSTEPYPFENIFQKTIDQGFCGLLVDGEELSWYGIRTLRFLLRIAS